MIDALIGCKYLHCRCQTLFGYTFRKNSFVDAKRILHIRSEHLQKHSKQILQRWLRFLEAKDQSAKESLRNSLSVSTYHPTKISALISEKSQAIDEYHQLAGDVFQIVSEWYHFAILELLRVDGFRPDIRWISNALGISVSETRAALERLTRVGMLEIKPDGSWRDTSEKATSITPGSTSGAQRLLQKRILELAIQALEDTPISERDQTAVTMAIDLRRLPRRARGSPNFAEV